MRDVYSFIIHHALDFGTLQLYQILHVNLNSIELKW